jgi:hypothetical protein
MDLSSQKGGHYVGKIAKNQPFLLDDLLKLGRKYFNHRGTEDSEKAQRFFFSFFALAKNEELQFFRSREKIRFSSVQPPSSLCLCGLLL